MYVVKDDKNGYLVPVVQLKHQVPGVIRVIKGPGPTVWGQGVRLKLSRYKTSLRNRMKSIEHGNWKIKNNQEIEELHKDLDKIVDMKGKTLECLGIWYKLINMGWLRRYLIINWKEEERQEGQYLRTLKVKRREKAMTVTKWAPIVKEVKAVIYLNRSKKPKNKFPRLLLKKLVGCL